MRYLQAFLLAVLLGAGRAEAAGTRLDPLRCPAGDWLPGPSVPQDVTNLLCRFLLAADRGDETALRAMSSTDIRADRALGRFAAEYSALRTAGQARYGDRYAAEVLQDGRRGDYLFKISDRASRMTEQIFIHAGTGRLFPPFADLDTFDVAVTGVRLDHY